MSEFSNLYKSELLRLSSASLLHSIPHFDKSHLVCYEISGLVISEIWVNPLIFMGLNFHLVVPTSIKVSPSLLSRRMLHLLRG